MGCGAISSADQVLEPQLQFRKLKSLYKNQQTQIWTCINTDKTKFSIKVFKKIFIHQQNQYMLKNFQSQIIRLYQLSTKQSNQSNKSFQPKKHLLPYIRAWKDQNCNLALIMQYIQQSSLADQVKGKLPGVFNQVMVAKFTQQILKTIKFLRSHGSIFCNFKTPNAFLDKSRQNIRLTDYYNLEQYFKLSQNNIFKNPIYSAPQNALFNQYFQQTDIWRVGCFIIQLLTCIKPWYKQTMNFDKIITNLKNHIKPPLPQKISSSCKNFLQKCFETDHNRRISLQNLLNHQFITQNILKSNRAPKLEQRKSYQRQNTEVQQIASYNLQIQLLQQSPRPNLKKISTQSKQSQTLRAYASQLTPLQNTTQVTRKKSISNLATSKKYQTTKIIISENDQNIMQKSTVDMKNSKNFRTKRFKTETFDSSMTKPNDISMISPYSKQKKQKQIIQLLNKKKAVDLTSPYASPVNGNLKASRKISQTGNYRLNRSKKKIPTNKITLNNQVLVFPGSNSSTKYWPSPQTPAPYNYLQTAQKLNGIIKQIQKQGGDKYYKKPLKLLKQRLKDKITLRTQTSITLQDSRALLQKSNEDIEQIDLNESQNTMNQNISNIQDEYHNQTEISKISYQTTHQNQVIQTLTSKALRQKFETQQKILRQQREKQKQKWEQELKEGREFIKNQINKRYYVSRNSLRIPSQIHN